MTRAAIYCRVSTDTQRENYSIPSQIQACIEHAESHGYKVVGDWIVNPETGLDSVEGVAAYVDDISSSEKNRPAISAAFAYLSRCGFDVLIVHAVDRLARSPGLLEVYEAQFQELGARVEYVIGNYESSAEGDVMKSIVAVMANFENVKRTERTIRGKKQKARSGLIVGSPPYGYIKNEGGIGGVVVIPSEAKIINRIFELFIIGKSIRGISKLLNVDGIPSPSGGSWGKSSIAQVLHREDYIGKAFYNRYKQVGKRRVENPKDEWIEILIPAIVPDGTFKKAAEILKHNKQHRRAQPKHFYFLSGLVYCSECGKPYSSHTTPAGKNRRKNVTKQYRHRGAKHGCINHYISTRMVDRAAIYTLVDIVIDPKFLKKAYGDYVDKYFSRDEKIKKSISSMDEEITKVTIKRDRVIDLYEDEIVSRRELESRVDSHNSTLDDLQRQREELTTQLSSAVTKADFQTFSEFIDGFRDTVLGFDAEHFRELLQLLNSRIVIQPGTRNATFQLSAPTGLLSTPSR